MATIVLNVPDETLASKVKRICQMLQGVVSVKMEKSTISSTKSKKQDITQTAGYREAMEDIRLGRVTHYGSLKEFYKEMGL